ncbi:unnamed protein product [Sphagnum jensenii]|uniref:Uncharacterized protein n=1 Tax=Sphagnum jensenii TaxID=128206 RepID=A0ABP0VCB9_9BRYO
MLVHAPELIQGMIEISYQPKWLETTFSAIKFSQCVIQGLWYTQHSLLQLPHLGESEVKAVSKTAKDGNNVFRNTFFCLPDSEKKGKEGLSKDQQQDVYTASSLLPVLVVETQLFVEEEEIGFDDGKDAAATAAEWWT